MGGTLPKILLKYSKITHTPNGIIKYAGEMFSFSYSYFQCYVQFIGTSNMYHFGYILIWEHIWEKGPIGN